MLILATRVYHIFKVKFAMIGQTEFIMTAPKRCQTMHDINQRANASNVTIISVRFKRVF